LLLKSQSNTVPDAGVIEIFYVPFTHIVQVWTFTPPTPLILSGHWDKRSSDIPLTLQVGDQLGARARADGFVEIYRNGVLVGTSDVRGWTFYKNGGYIGMWNIASKGTVMDDFGGGDTTGSLAPSPTPSRTPTNTPTATNSPVPSNTPPPTNTPVFTATITRTPSPTPTLTPTPTPTNTQAASGFPITVLLDNFNRVNGALGTTSWAGQTGSYAINGSRLDVNGDGAIFWKTPFGVNQEVFVTLINVDPTSDDVDLLLKSQRNVNPDGGVIEIWYQPSTGKVQVVTFVQAQGWVPRGADIFVTFQPGDRFGARARADGIVEVYKNETLIATRDVSAWPFYANSGYIGMWYSHSTATLAEDFGGGTIP